MGSMVMSSGEKPAFTSTPFRYSAYAGTWPAPATVRKLIDFCRIPSASACRAGSTLGWLEAIAQLTTLAPAKPRMAETIHFTADRGLIDEELTKRSPRKA